MAAADPDAGLIYVCNPNNPTGTLTSDADIDWLVDNLPARCRAAVGRSLHAHRRRRMRSDLVASGQAT